MARVRFTKSLGKPLPYRSRTAAAARLPLVLTITAEMYHVVIHNEQELQHVIEACARRFQDPGDEDIANRRVSARYPAPEAEAPSRPDRLVAASRARVPGMIEYRDTAYGRVPLPGGIRSRVEANGNSSRGAGALGYWPRIA